MATKTKTNGTKAADPLTPAQLRDAIRATVAHYFPHCEDVSLILVPAPGTSPMEMPVTGSAVEDVRGVADVFFSEHNGGLWEPVEDAD
jgi:hypothetical protein